MELRALEMLDRLAASDERFHGWDEDVHEQWKLDRESLELIMLRSEPGARTLETGCGYSTVAFGLARTRHTSVTPFEVEVERIRSFCQRNEISLDGVEFVMGCSQEVLPRLEDEPLDLVLIDGSHAFPIPFIDWYYTALRLRVGGTLVVDDTHIKTGEILRDFLTAEDERWALVKELPSLVAFEKVAEPLLPPWDWPGQPYCAKPRRVKGLRPTRMQSLRNAVALRTRARRALARVRPGKRSGH